MGEYKWYVLLRFMLVMLRHVESIRPSEEASDLIELIDTTIQGKRKR